jgi:hypothetical protein
LKSPLVVLVTNDKGEAISGQWISFKIKNGSAFLSDSLVITNELGKAEILVILNDYEGEISIEAKMLNTNISVNFTVTSARLPATKISIMSGNNQVGDPGYELTEQLLVLATNERNKPVNNVIILFSINSGLGTLVTECDTTDSNGLAYTKLILGFFMVILT